MPYLRWTASLRRMLAPEGPGYPRRIPRPVRSRRCRAVAYIYSGYGVLDQSYANFRELRYGEVRRIPIPRTRLNSLVAEVPPSTAALDSYDDNHKRLRVRRRAHGRGQRLHLGPMAGQGRQRRRVRGGVERPLRLLPQSAQPAGNGHTGSQRGRSSDVLLVRSLEEHRGHPTDAFRSTRSGDDRQGGRSLRGGQAWDLPAGRNSSLISLQQKAELPRIPIPRTSVNKGRKKGRGCY